MKNLEEIRDSGGLAVLKDVPVGKTFDFHGKSLFVGRSDDNVKRGKLACAGCYFLWHPINDVVYDQCACLKYCTAPNRKDRQSVFYMLDTMNIK